MFGATAGAKANSSAFDAFQYSYPTTDMQLTDAERLWEGPFFAPVNGTFDGYLLDHWSQGRASYEGLFVHNWSDSAQVLAGPLRASFSFSSVRLAEQKWCIMCLSCCLCKQLEEKTAAQVAFVIGWELSALASSQVADVRLWSLVQILSPEQPVTYTVLVNQTATHAVPAALNSVHNDLLKALTGNPQARITVTNHPMPTLSHEAAIEVSRETGRLQVQ